MRLVYPINVNTTSSAGVTSYTFAINDLFDPNFTGVGSQPVYFDQWMTLYTRYRVVAVDVEFDYMGDAGIARIACGPNPTLATGLTFDDMSGQRGAQVGFWNIGGPPARMQAHYDINKLFGIPRKALLGSVVYSGTSGSSPSSRMGWTISVSTSGASQGNYLSGRIIFSTRFEEPQTVNLSLAKPLPAKAAAPIQAAAESTCATVTQHGISCMCQAPHPFGPR